MNALSCIAPSLRTFIAPQVEQLGIRAHAERFGFSGRIDAARGTGFLWAVSVDEDCLVTAHRLRLDRPLRLEERPTDYGCLCSVSRATVDCSPVRPAAPVATCENLLAFVQAGGVQAFDLEPQESYEAVSLCFTPPFFAALRERYPHDFDTLEEDMRRAPLEGLPGELRALLRSLSPARAALPGAEAFFHAKALEAASLVVGHAAEARRARCAGGAASQRQLVEDARALVEAHLGEHLTLEALASQLYVGRTRLCAAFREETGMGPGAYVRARRMERACELLASTSLPVAEVARAVGYPHTSAFSEAFAREEGASPTAWREQA